MDGEHDKAKRWRPRFSLTGMLVVSAALPVGVGLVLAIDELAWVNAFVYLDGYSINWGLQKALRLTSSDSLFVYFLDIRLPGFLVLDLTGFITGLIRSRKLHVLFCLLPVSMILLLPVSMILPLVSSEDWLPWLWYSLGEVYLAGALSVTACWLAGWLIRGRRYDRGIHLKTRWKRFAIIGVLSLTIPLSTYGWSGPAEQPPISLLIGSGLFFVVVLPSIPICMFGYDLYRWRIALKCVAMSNNT